MFQRAPRTPEEVAKNGPLSIPPDQVADMTEAEWYAKVYRGADAPQLTLRAAVMGSVLGFFLAFTNLYIGLKTGWHLGVAITACILSFAIWNLFRAVGAARTPMTILENNCMQSTASAAGYSTGGTMVSAIAALLLLSVTPEMKGGEHLPWFVLTAWTVALAMLGVVVAIPMKRNLINQERLKFPSGLAAGVTLQSLYASGSDATRKAVALGISGLVGALFPPLIDLTVLPRTDATGKLVALDPLLPGTVPIFDWLPALGTVKKAGEVVAAKPSDWTITWDANPVMVAAGMLVGLRTSIWMAVGGLILAYVAGPFGQTAEWTNLNGDVVYAVSKPPAAWREIGLWLGAPMLVASGLLSFAFQWRTILRAVQGVFNRGANSGDAEMEKLVAATEVPFSWFAVGLAVSGAAVVAIAALWFEIPFYFGILAVLLTMALALVAARATGESDITPTGAMGKIMQLTYGVLIPQSTTANLMTAGITAGAASSCADLLTDLKSGYVLGANPRRQFIAQALGIASGTVATVLGFYILVPDATAMTGTVLADGTEVAAAFPAPSAQSWKAVAEVFRLGIDNLHPMHRNAIFVGLGVGTVLTLIEAFVPKSLKTWLPTPTGLALGLILPFQYPLSMLVGAVAAFGWQKINAKSAEDYLVPVSAGLIAGISIIGVIVAAINNFVLSGLVQP
jgi:OPT family oligopeptide transporter